jgi:alpha-galactosidase
MRRHPVVCLVLLPILALLPAALSAQTPRTFAANGLEIEVVGDLGAFGLDVASRRVADGLEIVALKLTSAKPARPPEFRLRWSIPSHDVEGQWATSRHMTKTVRPDWSSGRLQASMFAREAPVSALYSSDDGNVLTFAASDALNTLLVGSGVREEDGRVYNEVAFFTEPHAQLTEYTAEIRLDRRPIPYYTALREVGEWWAGQPGYAPAPVPEGARRPVYSTWYNYHQSVDAAELLKELSIARPMGMESIIVDDGWQTLDTHRGYAYTGDWEPERIPEMKRFVDGAHERKVKVLLWYAVPFVGKNSKAAARFSGKSLRYIESLGAYVLDPRYPEVRQYLVDVYRNAVRDWGVDGFKLDFIERFTADENTVLTAEDGRDYASVNEATDRMMTDIMAELRKMNPDVMIEFRQPYIGPLIRKYGNMLRASDSPNAYVANRVKTVDLRLLSGNTPVHADMIMWHPGEPVEKAALQFANILFAVPQVSVRLGELSPDHLAMVRFYLDYWNTNRDVLLGGDFAAHAPSSNYPLIRARTPQKEIVGLYDDLVVRLDAQHGTPRIDIVNAKASELVTLSAASDLGRYRYTVRDCQGRVTGSGEVRLSGGAVELSVPVSGILALERAG